MANTANMTVSGTWEVVHTSTANDTRVVITPKAQSIEWVVREDTTPPADSFVGHTLQRGYDREFVLSSGETFFIRGRRDDVIPYTVTGGA